MQGNTIIRTTQRTIATNTPAAIANNANNNKFVRIIPINHSDEVMFINADQIESIVSVH